jgi:hypothetical protein
MASSDRTTGLVGFHGFSLNSAIIGYVEPMRGLSDASIDP